MTKHVAVVCLLEFAGLSVSRGLHLACKRTLIFFPCGNYFMMTSIIYCVNLGHNICWYLQAVSVFVYVVPTLLITVLAKRIGIRAWASYQIRNIAGVHAPEMPGTFSLPPRMSNPDMHHGSCVTHVPWCMPGSLSHGFQEAAALFSVVFGRYMTILVTIMPHKFHIFSRWTFWSFCQTGSNRYID